jgi:hypothetical protein
LLISNALTVVNVLPPYSTLEGVACPDKPHAQHGALLSVGKALKEALTQQQSRSEETAPALANISLIESFRHRPFTKYA